MRKQALDNLTRGPKPSLHPAQPDWDTLKGLVERASSLKRNRSPGGATLA